MAKNTITLDDLKSEFGSYYINGGQNANRVLKLTRQKTVTTTHAKPLFTDDTLYRFVNPRFGQVLQQFQLKYTPKGGAEFIPRQIQLYQIKIDQSFFPDEVTPSWVGFMADKEEADRSKWPISRYMVEEAILPQIPHELEMYAYGKGKYAAPIEGTAGSADKTLDGIITLCDAGVLNSKSPMNKVILSAKPDAKNSVLILEEFVKNIDRLFRDNFKFKLFVDPQILDDYRENYRDRFSNDPRYTEGKAGSIDFKANIELVGLPSLSDTGVIMSTPADNFIHIRRTRKNNPPRLETSKRQVDVMMDWWEGLGFGFNELVWYYKPTV